MPQAFNPVPITLADGVTRHLQYSFGDVRRIKAKFAPKPEAPAGATAAEQFAASAFAQILAHPPEEVLPELLMMGFVEKEGLTQQLLEDKLLLGPMIEYAQLQFTEAFFGDRPKRLLEGVIAGREKMVKALNPEKAATPELPAISDPTTVLQ
jgi:hypothetical protein